MVNYLYHMIQDTSSLDQVKLIHTYTACVIHTPSLYTYTRYLSMLYYYYYCIMYKPQL